MFDYILDVLHAYVPLSTLICAFLQIIGEHIQLVLWQIFFVAELMFKARPEVHGDSSQLHFYLDEPLFVFKEDRYFDYEMKTSVAVWLRVLDVVLFFDKENVVLT